MITRPTVLILGAGASAPYGYPSGNALLTDIVNRGHNWLKGISDRPELPFEDFISALRDSDHSSVDAFVEHRPRFLEIGKLAIGAVLLECERENMGRLKGDWYQYLLTAMNGPLEKFANNQVSFITFNYDRSLEYYLFTSLRNRYEEKPEVVADVLRKLQFIHVHGDLGRLPWQESPNGPQNEFADLDRKLYTGGKNIKIISESADDSSEFQAAHQLMNAAHFIFLLGFGYSHVNMRRLSIPFNKTVRGSSFGLTDAEAKRLERSYKGLVLPVPQAQWGVLDFLRNAHEFQLAISS